jgi:tetraacyldisaccharide 4'-kinase
LAIPPVFLPSLSAMGLEFSRRIRFLITMRIVSEDLAFANGGVLLMTEKDAVKCAGLALPEAWVLPVEAQIDEAPDGRVRCWN